MLANFHTHTTFSDGKNTPEEIILYAIEKGFSVIGFSDHGFTPYDECYCMKDLTGYVKEINKLKKKYKNKIQVYIGVEEDIVAFNFYIFTTTVQIGYYISKSSGQKFIHFVFR